MALILSGVQYFNVWARKTAGAPTPTIDVQLWEDGNLVATVLSGAAVTSTTGEIISAPWHAALLGVSNNGSLVECRVISTPGSATNTVEIGAIEWIVNYSDEIGNTDAIPPDAIISSTNLSGSIGNITDDPDAPDSNWLTAISVDAGIDLQISFPNPGGQLTGPQHFSTYLRKVTGASDQTVDVELYEWDGDSWNYVATLTNDLPVTSTSGQLNRHDWNAAQLTNPSQLVACRIVGGGS